MEFRLEEAIPLLETTPATLAAWLAPLPAAWTTLREPPDGWTVEGVLGHLIHGEDTDWIPRARIILEHGESRPFEPYDRLAQEARFKGWTRAALLDRFGERRAANLETLRGWKLDAAALARRGTHPAFGAVTLSQLLATWVVHDLSHVSQIARILGKQYADAVGPWSEYLGVIRRG